MNNVKRIRRASRSQPAMSERIKCALELADQQATITVEYYCDDVVTGGKLVMRSLSDKPESVRGALAHLEWRGLATVSAPDKDGTVLVTHKYISV